MRTLIKTVTKVSTQYVRVDDFKEHLKMFPLPATFKLCVDVDVYYKAADVRHFARSLLMDAVHKHVREDG